MGIASGRAGLVGQSLSYVGITGLRIVLTIALLPLVLQRVGPVVFGAVTTAQIGSSVLAGILGLGSHGGITRHYFLKTRKVETAGLTVALNLLSLAIGGLLLPVSLVRPDLTLAFGFPFWGMLAWAVPIAVLTNLLAIFRAQERVVVFGLATVVQATAGPIGGLVHSHLVGEATASSYLAGGTIALVASTLLLHLPLGGHALSPITNWAVRSDLRGDLRWAVEIGLPLVPHVIAMWLLNAGDRFVVNRIMGIEESGYYHLAYMIGQVPIVFLIAANNAWGPRVYAEDDADRRAQLLERIQSLALLVVTPLSVAAAIAAPLVLPLLGIREGVSGLTVAAALIALSSYAYLRYLVAVRVLFYEQVTRSLAAITPLVATVNVLLNLVMVPMMGYAGAGLATAASYWMLAEAVRRRATRFSGPRAPRARDALPLIMGIGFATLWAVTGHLLALALALGFVAASVVFGFRDQHVAEENSSAPGSGASVWPE